MLKRILVSLALGLALVSLAGAAAFQDDLQSRRTRFMQSLGSDSMLILWSAPVRVYSGDVNYPYRQDSNFFYLTVIEHPESILVMLPGNKIRKVILFIRPRDAVREHWEGHSLTMDEATRQSGIGTVYQTTDFEPFLNSVLAGKSYETEIGVTSSDYEAFFAALKSNSAQIAVVGPPPGVSG